MPGRKLIYRVHALRRMFERRISDAEVEATVESGEVIETYPVRISPIRADCCYRFKPAVRSTSSPQILRMDARLSL